MFSKMQCNVCVGEGLAVVQVLVPLKDLESVFLSLEKEVCHISAECVEVAQDRLPLCVCTSSRAGGSVHSVR